MEAIIGLVGVLVWFGFLALAVVCFWRIFRKAGFHGAWGFLALVPFVNFLALLYLAFAQWPVHKELKDGALPRPKPVGKGWIVIVCMVGVFLIMALMAAIAIPNLLRARLSANEALAQSTVKTVAGAAEQYALTHDGVYPQSEYYLTTTNPPYLKETRLGKTVAGYRLSGDFSFEGYTIMAEPETCGTTGTKVYIQRHGRPMEIKECAPGRGNDYASPVPGAAARGGSAYSDY